MGETTGRPGNRFAAVGHLLAHRGLTNLLMHGISASSEEAHMSPSLVNHVRRAAMAGLAATLAILAWASPSVAADGGNSGVVATGGGRLNVRATPSLSGKVVGTKTNAARVGLVCRLKGDKVNGTRRTTIWWNKVKG